MSGFGGKIGVEYDRGTDDTFTIEKVDTTFFVPSTAYLQKSLNAPEVKEYLKASRWKKVVYLVTGLKVARGVSVMQARKKNTAGSASLGLDGMPVGVPINVGSEVDISKKIEGSLSFDDSSDCVFAFRLRKISYKKGIVVKSEQFNQGTMFGDDDDGDGDEAANPHSKDAVQLLELAEEDTGVLDFLGKQASREMDDEQDEECMWVIPAKQ